MAKESLILKHLAEKALIKQFPFHATFELTPRCNLNCRMCYIHRTPAEMAEEGRELTAEEWLQIASQLKAMGTLHILLTGGEPLLHPEFRKIYSGLQTMGFLVSVNTNAALMKEEDLLWFAKNPPFRISVTLYGASPETYEKLCRQKGGFEKTIRSLIQMKELQLPVFLKSTITKWNVKDAIAICEIGRQLGMETDTSSDLFPPIRRQNRLVSKEEAKRYSTILEEYREAVLSPEEAAVCKKMVKDWELSEEEKESFYRRLREGNLDGILNNECRTDPANLSCGAGKHSLWITWNGDMIPCGVIPINPQPLLQISAADAWKKVRETVDAFVYPRACRFCTSKASCSMCMASCVAEASGDEAPPETCARTKETLKLFLSEAESL